MRQHYILTTKIMYDDCSTIFHIYKKTIVFHFTDDALYCIEKLKIETLHAVLLRYSPRYFWMSNLPSINQTRCYNALEK